MGGRGIFFTLDGFLKPQVVNRISKINDLESHIYYVRRQKEGVSWMGGEEFLRLRRVMMGFFKLQPERGGLPRRW